MSQPRRFCLKLVPSQQWACRPWPGLGPQLPNASSFHNTASLPWNSYYCENSERAFPPLYLSVSSWELKLLPSFLWPRSRLLGGWRLVNRGNSGKKVWRRGPEQPWLHVQCATLDLRSHDENLGSHPKLILSLHPQWMTLADSWPYWVSDSSFIKWK